MAFGVVATSKIPNPPSEYENSFALTVVNFFPKLFRITQLLIRHSSTISAAVMLSLSDMHVIQRGDTIFYYYLF
jgi:hypothetical protein